MKVERVNNFQRAKINMRMRRYQNDRKKKKYSSALPLT